MTFKFAIAASAACLALAACNTSNGSPGGLSSKEAQQVDATYKEYQDRIDSGDLTAVTDTPTGQASMSGYMGISGVNPDDPTTTVLGKLAMDINFDDNSVGGTVSNLGIYSGEKLTKDSSVSGTLDVSGTAGTTLAATASGDLRAPGDSGTTNFNVDMTGSFYDDAGTLTTVGDVSGTMTEAGSEPINVGGNYYATEN